MMLYPTYSQLQHVGMYSYGVEAIGGGNDRYENEELFDENQVTDRLDVE